MRAAHLTPAQRWALRLGSRVLLAFRLRRDLWWPVDAATWHDGTPEPHLHDQAVAASLVRSLGFRVLAVRWCKHGAEVLGEDRLGRSLTRRVTWDVIDHHQDHENLCPGC